jgi:hypothetical protein
VLFVNCLFAPALYVDLPQHLSIGLSPVAPSPPNTSSGDPIALSALASPGCSSLWCPLHRLVPPARPQPRRQTAPRVASTWAQPQGCKVRGLQETTCTAKEWAPPMSMNEDTCTPGKGRSFPASPLRKHGRNMEWSAGIAVTRNVRRHSKVGGGGEGMWRRCRGQVGRGGRDDSDGQQRRSTRAVMNTKQGSYLT